MKKKLLFLTVLVMVLSACGPASLLTASRTTPAPSVNQEPVSQIVAPVLSVSQEPVSQVITPMLVEKPVQAQPGYTSQDFGFSLNLPDGYEAQRANVQTINFLATQDTQGNRARGWMEVERTLDQDARWFADQAVQDNAILGVEISSPSTSVIDGQQAYILEGMPGQVLSRQVFIVYDSFLYHLTFVPDDPQTGADYQQMEVLYAAVNDSLRFVPQRELTPPVITIRNMVYQLEKALEARSEGDLMPLIDEEFSLANLMVDAPHGVTFERFGRYGAARWILDRYLSQAPDLTLETQVDWTSSMGDPFPFSRFFPDQVITPVLVKGWGAQGTDDAVMIIAHRSDGSLYWRDLFVIQGTFAP